MIIHIIKTWKKQDKTNYKRFNEIVYVIILIAFGLYYPLMILNLSRNIKGVIFPTATEEFTFFGNFLIVGVIMGIALWGISAKIRTFKHPELLKTLNNYENFCKEFLEEYPERNKIKRRITHILPFVVVVLCIIIFYLFFRGILGDAWSNYALFFIIIIGVDFAITFLIQDLVRLFDFSYMPPNAIKMCKAGLTPDELDSFSSTSVMVFSFGPFVFLSFPIFFIVLLITSVADAMAAIVGISIGDKKHRFPKSTDKSIEGYVAGFLFTFICSLFGGLFSNFFGLSNWSINFTLILSFILAVVFVLIDLITSKVKIQDNYLNPFIIGLTIIITLTFFNISIY